MLLIMMVFIASLCFSVVVSRQRQQIERLIEETAILAAEIRDEREQRGTRDQNPGARQLPSTHVVARQDAERRTGNAH